MHNVYCDKFKFFEIIAFGDLVYIDAYSLESSCGCVSLYHIVAYKFESSGLTKVILNHCCENLVGTSEFQI